MARIGAHRSAKKKKIGLWRKSMQIRGLSVRELKVEVSKDKSGRLIDSKKYYIRRTLNSATTVRDGTSKVTAKIVQEMIDQQLLRYNAGDRVVVEEIESEDDLKPLFQQMSATVDDDLSTCVDRIEELKNDWPFKSTADNGR